MGAMTGNVFIPVTARFGKTFQEGGSVAGAVSQPLYRSCAIKRFAFRSNRQIKSQLIGQPLQGAMNDATRVEALEAELLQYRYMIEKMVLQRTEQLDRRVLLLKCCNSKLCDEFGKMREKYLDLLRTVQPDEAGANCYA